MSDLVKINEVAIPYLEYKKEPVITFDLIDQLHEKVKGSSSRTFIYNKKLFIEGKHYYFINNKEFLNNEIHGLKIPNRGLILLTERGYLLLVKSFRDKLSYEIQEKLIDCYFLLKSKKISNNVIENQLDTLIDKIDHLEIKIETLEKTKEEEIAEKLNKLLKQEAFCKDINYEEFYLNFCKQCDSDLKLGYCFYKRHRMGLTFSNYIVIKGKLKEVYRYAKAIYNKFNDIFLDFK